MRKFKLTQAGINLLGTSHCDGETRYWIGYYGLAYVPDRDLDPISESAQTGKLTKTGDYIYNIWQGDMVNGYAQENPEDTAAASLFGLTLYDKSIRTNYRYVYDHVNGRNRMVAWKSLADAGTGENTLERKGYAVYNGATENEESELPLPAPLYYRGEPSDDSIHAVVSSASSVADDVARVSADTRFYVGTPGGVASNKYGWDSSSKTTEAGNIYVDDEEILESISNFNKFHGTVSSEGYGVSSVSSCHNMSKATRLFPINYYSVVNDNGAKVAETKYADNSPARKSLATAIKFSIDLSPVTADNGYTTLNYEPSDLSDDQDTDTAVYETKYNSFKFNRIGIYAVPMTVHRYSTDTSAEGCDIQKVQFEISGDEDPVLFAVADINDTIISDNPSSDEGGIAKFSLEFILNLGNGDEETQIEQRTAVYYNLYENDAITWYKNQLLASASLSEAVTDLSLEVNALKQQAGNLGGSECCSSGIDMSRYALKNHTHDYMRNLVDARDGEGSVRGIATLLEGNISDIWSVSGLRDNAPEGYKDAIEIPAASGIVDGVNTSIVHSYIYDMGFTTPPPVDATDNLTVDQLKLTASVITEHIGKGWFNPADDNTNDPDNWYIWVDDTHYAKINSTFTVTLNSFNSGDTSQYHRVIRKDGVLEPMFSDGYSAGKYDLIMGTNTASEGDYNVLQGVDSYMDDKSDLDSAIGVYDVTIKNTNFSSVMGQSFDVEDSANSIFNISKKTVRPYFSSVKSSLLLGEQSGDAGFEGGVQNSLLSLSTVTTGSGSAGPIVSSMFIGNATFDNVTTGGKSVHNSVIARGEEMEGYSLRGFVDNSLMLGEGYGNGFTNDGHIEEYDSNLNVSSSLTVKLNNHNYYSIGERKYLDSKDYPYTLPTVDNSIVIDSQIVKPITRSIVIGSGSLSVSAYSVNGHYQYDSNDHILPTSESIIIGDGLKIGSTTKNSIILGSGGNMADNMANFLMLAASGNSFGHHYYDYVYNISEFNEAYATGTLSNDKWYVIIGDGTIKVWDATSGTYKDVTLNTDASNIYYGIYVDASGKVMYYPDIYQDITYKSNDGTKSYTVSKNVGKAKFVRENVNNIYNGLLIGTYDNGIESDSYDFSIIGSGNDFTNLSLHDTTVVGSGNSFQISNYLGSTSEGKPKTFYFRNVHWYGSGKSSLPDVGFMSMTDYSNSLVLNNGGQYEWSFYGLYTQPVTFNTITTTESTTGSLLTVSNWSPYVINPYLFSNYKTQVLAKGKSETDWNNYNINSTGIPFGLTGSQWSDVCRDAENAESDEDVYRGDAYALGGYAADPFTGKKRSDIRAMLGKPNTPMIYTGGIALGGTGGGNSGNNAALIKLGHVTQPVAYINSSPVSNWNSNMIVPVSITGTDKCPYAGMTLTIDGTQELDGTLHLVLAKSSYIASNIMTDVKRSLGIANGLGDTNTPVYVDSTGTFKACTGGDCIVHAFQVGSYPDGSTVKTQIASDKFIVLYKRDSTNNIKVYLYSNAEFTSGDYKYIFISVDGSTKLTLNVNNTWTTSPV